MSGSIIYLAVPYTARRTYTMMRRAAAADAAAAYLVSLGHLVFSPISMGHSIAMAGKRLKLEIPHDYKAWKELDRAMIRAADKLVVLKLPGWEMSVGVEDEVDYALSLGKPVECLEYPEVRGVGMESTNPQARGRRQ